MGRKKKDVLPQCVALQRGKDQIDIPALPVFHYVLERITELPGYSFKYLHLLPKRDSENNFQRVKVQGITRTAETGGGVFLLQ